MSRGAPCSPPPPSVPIASPRGPAGPAWLLPSLPPVWDPGLGLGGGAHPSAGPGPSAAGGSGGSAARRCSPGRAALRWGSRFLCWLPGDWFPLISRTGRGRLHFLPLHTSLSLDLSPFPPPSLPPFFPSSQLLQKSYNRPGCGTGAAGGRRRERIPAHLGKGRGAALPGGGRLRGPGQGSGTGGRNNRSCSGWPSLRGEPPASGAGGGCGAAAGRARRALRVPGPRSVRGSGTASGCAGTGRPRDPCGTLPCPAPRERTWAGVPAHGQSRDWALPRWYRRRDAAFCAGGEGRGTAEGQSPRRDRARGTCLAEPG